MAENEGWSWSKFFGGFFNGLNTAKAITTTFHQILIVLVIGSLTFAGYKVYKHYHKPKATALPISVTTNSGTVHSSTDDNRKKTCFLSLCF